MIEQNAPEKVLLVQVEHPVPWNADILRHSLNAVDAVNNLIAQTQSTLSLYEGFSRDLARSGPMVAEAVAHVLGQRLAIDRAEADRVLGILQKIKKELADHGRGQTDAGAEGTRGEGGEALQQGPGPQAGPPPAPGGEAGAEDRPPSRPPPR